MNLNYYLLFSLILIVTDSFIGLFSILFFYTDIWNSSYLKSLLILDSIFILSNLYRTKLKKIEFALIIICFFSFAHGLIFSFEQNFNYNLLRNFKDTLPPIIFTLKVCIMRQMFNRYTPPNWVYFYHQTLFMSSIIYAIFILILYDLVQHFGFAPPINLPLAYAIYKRNLFLISAIMTVVWFAGKMSLLLSAVAVLFMAVKNIKFAKSILIFIFSLTIIFLSETLIIHLNKLAFLTMGFVDLLNKSTQTQLTEWESMRHNLYNFSSGRTEEFFGIVQHLDWYNWLIGLGGGFTYNFMFREVVISNYSNVHFSPLGLIYKYGIFGAVAFYWYIFGTIINSKPIKNGLNEVLYIVLILFFLQSMFTFNLFVSPLLAIIVAKLYSIKSQQHHQLL